MSRESHAEHSTPFVVQCLECAREDEAAAFQRGAAAMKRACVEKVHDFDDWTSCPCSECKYDAHAHAVDTRSSMSTLATALASVEVKEKQ